MKSMVETIQHIQKNKPKQKGHPHPWRDGTQPGRIWQTLLLWKGHKFQEVMNSQEKMIIIKEIFLGIGKQILETNYTLNLGKLL
jgi:hypothetical protein